MTETNEQAVAANAVVEAAKLKIAEIEKDLASLDEERAELLKEKRKYNNVVKTFG